MKWKSVGWHTSVSPVLSSAANLWRLALLCSNTISGLRKEVSIEEVLGLKMVRAGLNRSCFWHSHYSALNNGVVLMGDDKSSSHDRHLMCQIHCWMTQWGSVLQEWFQADLMSDKIDIQCKDTHEYLTLSLFSPKSKHLIKSVIKTSCHMIRWAMLCAFSLIPLKVHHEEDFCVWMDGSDTLNGRAGK